MNLVQPVNLGEWRAAVEKALPDIARTWGGDMEIYKRIVDVRTRALQRAIGVAEEWLCIVCLVAIAAILNLQILDRYVMDDPMIWPEEIARCLMIWVAWIGTAAVTRRGAHIGFDLLFSRLTGPVRIAYDTLIDILTGGFFMFLAIQGWKLAIVTADLTMAATELPTSLIVWPLVIGAGLSVFHCIVRVVTRLTGTAELTPAPLRELV